MRVQMEVKQEHSGLQSRIRFMWRNMIKNIARNFLQGVLPPVFGRAAVTKVDANHGSGAEGTWPVAARLTAACGSVARRFAAVLALLALTFGLSGQAYAQDHRITVSEDARTTTGSHTFTGQSAQGTAPGTLTRWGVNCTTLQALSQTVNAFDGLGFYSITSAGVVTVSAFNPRTYQSLAHNGSDAGSTICLELNNGGTVSTRTFAVRIIGQNDRPTLENNIPNQTGEKGRFSTFPIPANTFDDVDTGDKAKFRYSLRQVATGGGLVTAPTWMSLSPDTTSVRVDAPVAANNEYTLRVTVNDQSGTSNAAQDSNNFTLTLAGSEAITTVADTGTIDEDNKLQVTASTVMNMEAGLLSNDTTTGNTFSVTKYEAGSSITVSAVGPSTALINVSTHVIGTCGTLSITANGGYVYDPTTNDTAQALDQGDMGVNGCEDEFTYEVTDDTLSSVTATGTLIITVTGVNDAPVLVERTDPAADKTVTESGRDPDRETMNLLNDSVGKGKLNYSDPDANDITIGTHGTFQATGDVSSTGTLNVSPGWLLPTDDANPISGTQKTRGRSITGTYGYLFFKSSGDWTYELDDDCGGTPGIQGTTDDPTEANDPGCETETLRNGLTPKDHFAFRVDDGDTNTANRYSEAAIVSVTVRGGSDIPTATPATDLSVPTNEYLEFEASDTRFGFADVDDNTGPDGMFGRVKIITLPVIGTFYNDGVAVVADAEILAGDLDDLVYVPACSPPCRDSFTYRVGDSSTFGSRAGGFTSHLFSTIAAMSISVAEATAGLPTVSISDLNFPSTIAEGGTGNVTFVRTGSIVSTLQAYAQVTSDGLSSDIDLSLMFPPGKATVVAGVMIPPNSLTSDSTATLAVLPLSGTPSALSGTPRPDLYEVGTGNALKRTFALTEASTGTGPVITERAGANKTAREAGGNTPNRDPGDRTARGGFDVTNASGTTPPTFEVRSRNTSGWTPGTGDSAMAAAVITGTYGQLRLQLDGDWNYTLDNECGATYGHQGVAVDATEANDPGCATERLNEDPGYNSTENFFFRAGNAGLYSNVVEVSISVTGNSDNPVTHSVPAQGAPAFIANDGSGYRFKASDFPFSDSDDSRTRAGQAMSVKITQSPTAGTGTLFLGSSSLGAGSVLITGIHDLLFRPSSSAVDGSTSSFKFRMVDGSNAESAEATFTLTVSVSTIVSITAAPDRLTEGGAAGAFTFARTGGGAAAANSLNAYGVLRFGTITRFIPVTFESEAVAAAPGGSGNHRIHTAMVSVPANILTAHALATMSVATPTEATGQTPAPGAYSVVSTGNARSRPLIIENSDGEGANSAPQAADDAVVTDESVASVTGNVITGPTATHPGLGLDLDANDAGSGSNRSLSVSRYQRGTTLTTNASTGVNQDLPGAYGTLNIAVNGNFTYTLNGALAQGASGLDTFTYRLTDDSLATDTALLTFTVQGFNDAPTLAEVTTPAADKDVKEAGMTNNADPAASGGVAFMGDDDAGDSALGTGNTLQATAGDGSSGADWMTPSDTDNGGKGRGVPGAYGTLFLKANGTWTYALDDTNTTVQALTDNEMAMDRFAFRLDDGADIIGDTRYSEIVPLVVRINGTSDIPTASPARPPISMNNILRFAEEDFGFEDVDSGVDGEFREVRIETLPTPNGTLRYQGQPAFAGLTSVPVAMLDELTFSPGMSATPSFTFRVRDNRAAGGHHSEPATMNIDVIMNADLPAVSISETGFPGSITEGMSAMVTFERTMPHTHPLQAYALISGTGVKRGAPISVEFAEGAGSTRVDVPLLQNAITANGTLTLAVVSPAVAIALTPAPGIYSVAETGGSRSFTGTNVPGGNSRPTLAAAAGANTDVKEPGGVNNASATDNLTAAGSVVVSDADVLDDHTYQATLHRGSSPTIDWQDPVDIANMNKGTRLAGEYGNLFFKSDGSWTYELNVTCIAAGDQGCTTHALHEGTNGDGMDEFAFRTRDDSQDATNEYSAVLEVDITVDGTNDNPTTIARSINVMQGTSYDFKASDFTFMDEDNISAGEGQFTFVLIGALTVATCGDLTDERGLNDDGTGTRARILMSKANQTFTVTEGGARPIEKMRFTAGATPCETTFTFAVLDSDTPTPALESPFTNYTINVLAMLAANNAPVAKADAFTITENAGQIEGQNVITGDNGSGRDDDADDVDVARLHVTRYSAGATLSSSPTTAGTALPMGTYGTMTLNGNGSFTYVLNDNIHELDGGDSVMPQFTYQLSDGASPTAGTATAVITITITGVDDAPVLTEAAGVEKKVVEAGRDTSASNAAARGVDPADPAASGGWDYADADGDDTPSLGAGGDPLEVTAGNGMDSPSWQPAADAANPDPDNFGIARGQDVMGTYGVLYFMSGGSWTYELDDECTRVNGVDDASDPGCATVKLHAESGTMIRDNFTFRAGTTGSYSDLSTLGIEVTGASDIPTTTPVLQTVPANKTLTLDADAFGFVDDDDSAHGNGEFGRVHLISAPTAGALHRGSATGAVIPARTNVTDNTSAISFADLSRLTFVPATCETTPHCAVTFKYRVSDNGGTGNYDDPGSSLIEPNLISEEATMTINVSPAFTPVVGDDIFTTDEDRTGAITGNLIAGGSIVGAIGGTLAADTDGDVGQTETLEVTRFALGDMESDLPDTDNAGMTISNAAGDHGTLTILASGAFTYTVDTAFYNNLDTGDTPTETWIYEVTDDGEPPATRHGHPHHHHQRG